MIVKYKLHSRNSILPLFCFFAALIAFCCGTKKSVFDSKTLERDLQQRGLTIQEIQEVNQPFFSTPAKGFVVDNDQLIQVFEFTDSQQAEEARHKVSPDGMTIGTTKPLWAAAPHFYAKERMIVLYVGQDQKILSVLSDILDAPFAGK